MARGWESKDVESQVEARELERRGEPAPERGELVSLRRHRDGLELSRTRVKADIAGARHPRHRTQLEGALEYLENQITETDAAIAVKEGEGGAGAARS